MRIEHASFRQSDVKEDGVRFGNVTSIKSKRHIATVNRPIRRDQQTALTSESEHGLR